MSPNTGVKYCRICLTNTTTINRTDPSLAYRNFVNTCRSEATRRVYIKALHYFMGYLRLPLQAYDKLRQRPKIHSDGYL